jgi:hypothetical protein
MNQPTIDTSDNAKPGADTDGKQWIMALLDPEGRMLAGRDLMGNFHCWVDSEVLFDNAMTTILHAQGVNYTDLLNHAERSDS